MAGVALDDNIKVVESLDDFGRMKAIISSPKFNSDFIVQKNMDGFAFFSVTSTKGSVPEELKGRFMGFDQTITRVKKYITKSKKTSTVRRDEKQKKRDEVRSRRN